MKAQSALYNHIDITDMLAVNQVVKAKVEQECNRVRSLIMACLADGAAKAIALDELKGERAVLNTRPWH